jgi:hypothetical protein
MMLAISDFSPSWGRVFEMVNLRHRLSVKPAAMMLAISDFSPSWGRVYQMVGFRRGWLVKPAPTNVCRGGFYE